jgi:hypothetical protein
VSSNEVKADISMVSSFAILPILPLPICPQFVYVRMMKKEQSVVRRNDTRLEIKFIINKNLNENNLTAAKDKGELRSKKKIPTVSPFK